MESSDATAVPTERLGRIGPPVRAIVVAHDPGDWFDETLQSLRDQDYAALSVTVVDVSEGADSADGTPSDVAARVAAVMPDATVMTVPGNPGFGPAVNAAARMLAGKDRLAEVDSAGGSVPSVPSGAGEADDIAFLLICHDDVVPAPDAVTLLVGEAVRRSAAVVGPKLVDWDNPGFLQCVGLSADRMGVPVPLVTVGEYDQGQHDAVAEVLAVPSACMLIRAEAFDRLGGFDGAMTFSGEDLDLCRRAGLGGETVLVVPEASARHLGRLEERRGRRDYEWLAYRHQLRSILVCARASQLAAEVWLMLALTVLEAALAALTGHLRRAAALVGAWLWNLLGLAEILSRRSQVADSPGADRVGRLMHRGYVSLVRFAGSLIRGDMAVEGAGVLWGRRRRFRDAARDVSVQTATAGWTVVLVLFIFGSRHLLTRGIPVFGEIALLGDSPRELFGAFFSNWREAGLGADGPAPTAYGILGVAGSVLFGAMGLTRTVLVLGLIPFGAAGLWRLLAGTGSRRAQIVGLVAFVAMPLPYNALANGVWSALAIYGTLPWICLGLARVLGPVSSGESPAATGFWLPTVLVGVVVALSWAFVPVTPLVLVMLVGALVVGGLLTGSTRRLAHLLGAAAGGLVAGWLLNWPAAPTSFGEIFQSGGARPDGSGDLTVAELLRFATGSAVASSLVWGLLAVAALALFVARGSRFTWAVRAWCLVVVSVLVALVAEHGWSPWDLPRPEVLLAPAGFGLALAAAVGASDITHAATAGRRRRWLPAGVGLAALVVGGIPALILTLDGRWGMPRGDFTTPLAAVEEESRLGAFRILWVGHPDVLPLGGWELDDRMVFATSTSVPPDVGLQWPGPRPAESERLRDAWRDAMSGGTDRMGERLAPLGVRYVVVMERIAPEPFGDLAEPAPPWVQDRLAAQFDLERQESRAGIAVYRNIAWRPSRTLLAGTGEVAPEAFAAPPNLALGDFDPPAEARGVLPPDSTLYLADAADDWVLRVGGTRIESRPALGWAHSFPTGGGGEATLRHEPAAANVTRIVLWSLVIVLVPLAFLRRRSLGFGSGAMPEPGGDRRTSDEVVSALLARARRES
ncbi:MAG: glycosyltransferase [bacterium]|nr:glycosyltransferase [bacterium]